MLGARKPAAESLAQGTRAAGKGSVEARRPGPAGGHEDDFHAADLASRLIRKLRGGIRRRLTADASFPGDPRGHATSSRENLGRSSQRDEASAVEVDLGAIIPWVFHRQGRAIRDIRGASNAACIAAGVFEIVNPAAPTAEQRKKAAKVYHDFRRTAVRNLERGGLPLGSHEADRPQDGSGLPPLRIVAEADLTEGVKKRATLRARTVKRAKSAERSTVTVFPLATGKERAKSAAGGG
jgi:hypothetical protein